MTNLLQQWSALLSAVPHKALGLAVWLLAMATVFGLLERWRPIRQQKFLRKNLGHDLGYYFIGGLLPPFFTVLAAVAIAWFASGLIPADFHRWVAALPLWLRIVALVLVGDLAFYWAHRWSHEVEWLWRLHSIHHSPNDLDWLVNTRAHPFDLVFARVVSALPVLVLGLRQPDGDMETFVGIYLTLTTVLAFFVHANLRCRLGGLEQIVATPAFHHWHHADDTPSSLNKNYASLFPWIDRLFGTYHLPAGRFPSSYGASRKLPSTLAAQLLSPFIEPRAAVASPDATKTLERPAQR